MLIDNNNNIVVTGSSVPINTTTALSSSVGSNTVFATIRLLPSGSLDRTFNSTGIVTTQLGTNPNMQGVNTRAVANSIALDNNNNYVVSGFSFDGIQNNVTTVRYLPDGDLDPTLNSSSSEPGTLISQILGEGSTASTGVTLGYTEDNWLSTASRKQVNPNILKRINSLMPVLAIPRINAEDENITNISSPFISGTAQPGSTITAFIDNVPYHVSVKADVNGNWELILPNLRDGTHRIFVNSSDEYTQLVISSKAVLLTIDTRRPFTPTIITPINNSFVNTTTPIIQGTAKPGSYVAIFINNNLAEVVVSNAQGRWSYTSRVLTEGKYQVSVVSEDRARNRSDRSKPHVFNIDVHAFRAPKIVTPIDKFVTNKNKPIISGEARADSRVNIYLNGKLTGTVTANQKGGWSYTPKISLPDGDYKLFASVSQS